MKYDYYDEAISFGNLYKGLKKSCRNVRWKDSVVGYENHALFNTYKLRQDLLNGTYKIGKYQQFKIYEPKERDICATRLRDRQFQRSLCDNGLYEDICEHFIRDNVACQKGRGTDDALNRLKIQMRRFYHKHGNTGYALKCDIHHFFQTTSHAVAKEKVIKYVSDKQACEKVCEIIDSFDTEYGIGLGSQVSQLVELLVLNDLDHYIKEKLHIKCYIRYADDFILIHEDKEYLKYCLNQIRDYLADMDLELNKKTSIFPLKQGIKFLQWKFIFNKSGKLLMLMNKIKLRREKKRLIKLLKLEALGKRPPGTAEQSLQSWLAHALKGNTISIQNEIHRFFNKEKIKWVKQMNYIN